MKGERLAAIDVGSNAIRLRIVESDGVREVLSARAAVRLGHDAFRNGELSCVTMNAAVEALRAFRVQMHRAGVGAYRAVATSATRESRNGEELLRRAKREADVGLEVIDGLEEARLVRVAVERAVGLSGRLALVDVGGGSTEVTTFEERRRTASASLPIGTVRMLGTFQQRGGRVARRTMDAIGDAVEQRLSGVARHLTRAERLIVTGGTARAFVRLCRHDDEPVTLERMSALGHELRRLTEAERIERYGLRADRADTVVMAGVILSRIAQTAGVPAIEAPSVGLRHGVLADLAEDQRRLRRAPAFAATA